MKQKEGIFLKNLSVKIHKTQVLKDINLELPHGKLISILGPSGAGKSSLLNTCAGFLKPQSGQVIIHPKKQTKNLGFVFQNSLLYEQISVQKNIALSLQNAPFWKDKTKMRLIKNFYQKNQSLFSMQFSKKLEKALMRLEKALKSREIALSRIEKSSLFLLKLKLFWKLLVKIQGKKYLKLFWKQTSLKVASNQEILKIAKELEIDFLLKKKAENLSGGERQRVALAKALVKNAQIIFLDEPFAALDAKIKEKAREQLKEIQQKYQVTMLFVTHDQNDAMLISDHVVLMKEGQIIQSGAPNDLFEKPKNLFVAKFIGHPEINFLYEDKNHQYYLHANKISLIKAESANKILSQQTNGNYFIIHVWIAKWKKEIRVVSLQKKYPLHTKVDIIYQSNDVLRFTKEGQLA